MNIVVKTTDGSVYCRPDTTWERENKDLFVPDGIDAYTYAPVIFARISKAGKCIGEKFADRYFDSFNFGALLYVGDNLATGSCYDHTSVLPGPLYNKIVLGGKVNEYILRKGEETIYSTLVGELESEVRKAIAEVSSIVSLRIGDYVAIELADRKELVNRAEKKVLLNAEFCENPLFDFNIVF